MTKLNQLTDASYSRKKRMRVGRGIGSGKGKTCGAGYKGQKSRSGVSINGFEGGQMPIYRRVPKRGFVNVGRVGYETLNLGEIQTYVDNNLLDGKAVIDRTVLKAAKLLRKDKPFKLLAKGQLREALQITADAASESAIEAVKKVGGKLILSEPKQNETAA